VFTGISTARSQNVFSEMTLELCLTNEKELSRLARLVVGEEHKIWDISLLLKKY
jgi:hypothetical protein